MEKPATVRGARLLALAGFVCAVTACSSLEGQRFEHETVAPGATLAGVPFMLNRPVPAITRVPGTDGAPDRYEIGFEYVPDPDARFTLQVDPTLLSSVDFTMTFDEKGSITETTAKTTDQSAPLIVALGKLVATGVALDQDTGKKTGKKTDGQLVDDLGAMGNTFLADKKNTITDPVTGKPRPVQPIDSAVWKQIIDRMGKLAREGTVRKRFVSLSAHEQALLEALLASRRNSPLGKPTMEGCPTDTVATDLAKMCDAFARLDKRTLAELKKELLKKRRTLRASYAMHPVPELRGKLTDNMDLLKRAATEFNAVDDLLVDVADLSTTEWQRRLVAYLDHEIDERRLAVRMQAAGMAPRPEAETKDPMLNALLTRKATALGVGVQRQRKLELIDAMKQRARTPRELQVLREEVAALEATEVAAENALKSSEKVDAVADAPAQAKLLRAARAKPLDESTWVAEQFAGKPLPLYAVVVEPVTADQSGRADGGSMVNGVGGGNVPTAPEPPPANKPKEPSPKFPITGPGAGSQPAAPGGSNE